MPHIRADCQNASYATEAGLSDTWLGSKFRGELFLPGTRTAAPLPSLPSGGALLSSGRGIAAGANRQLARTVRVHQLYRRESTISKWKHWKPSRSQLLSATNVRSNFSGGRSNFLRFEFTRAMVLYTTDVDCFNFFITIRVRYVTEYLMRNNGSSSADLVWGTLSGSRTPPRLGCLIVGRGPALIIYNAFTSRFFRERKVCYALSLRTLQR